MKKVIECVPNFSEGKDQKNIQKILDEINSVEGITIWDCLSDSNHNRTVITFVGNPLAVKTAAINSAIIASELIDMSKHKGEHPRIGAIDVIPFVPLVGSDIEECILIAQEVAEELSNRLNIPTYLYGDATTRYELKNLGYVQNIQYEGMFDKIKEEGYEPDFGPGEMNRKTGGSIIGARSILVAFNVNLGTNDIKIARSIAKTIRESGGGLKNVKAMGVELIDQNIVQVSMDMVNYKETPLYQSYELIKIEAARHGVPIVGSELIGLVPTDALVESAMYYFKLHDFSEKQLIENRLNNY